MTPWTIACQAPTFSKGSSRPRNEPASPAMTGRFLTTEPPGKPHTFKKLSFHYIMIKGSIHKEDITIINIYAPNIGALQYVRQMLTNMKGEINHNTIIVGNFNTPLTPMDKSTKQKINKETKTLNDTIDQLDLIDIYRTFHPKTMNFTFFSSAHGIFSRIDHILGYKSSLGKFKKIEIIPSIFSDHNAVRLDVNYRKKIIKNSNIWRLNNMLLSNQQITEEIKKEIKICMETNENENTITPNL